MRLMHLGRTEDFRNVTQARTVSSEHLRRIRMKRHDPIAERRRERSAGTLSQMFELWLAAVAEKRSPRTHANYQGYVNNYLAPEIGAHRPAEFTRGDAKRLHNKFTGRHGPVTANRVLQALRAAFFMVTKRRQRHPAAWIPKPGYYRV